MSMTAVYTRLSKDDLERLVSDPDSEVDAIIDGQNDGASSLDIHKSWHALHYILTGDPQGGEPPLANAVLGGEEIGEDLGYGAARLLKPDEVQQVAKALTPIDSERFAHLFNARDFSGAGIYVYDREPKNEDTLAELYSYFRQLKAFFEEAAKTNSGMLLYLI